FAAVACSSAGVTIPGSKEDGGATGLVIATCISGAGTAALSVSAILRDTMGTSGCASSNAGNFTTGTVIFLNLGAAATTVGNSIPELIAERKNILALLRRGVRAGTEAGGWLAAVALSMFAAGWFCCAV